MIFYKIFVKTTNFMFRTLYKVEINGIENVPSEGRVVICSNHVGLSDPVLITAMIPRKLNYMAKKELFKNKLLSLAITKLGAFPVDRNTSGLTAIKTSIKLLKEEQAFAMFPQGTRVQEEDSETAKPGAAMIAIKSKSPVLPIYIDTKYELFKKIKINIGSTLHFDEYFNTKLSTEDYEKISKSILTEIYKLK